MGGEHGPQSELSLFQADSPQRPQRGTEEHEVLFFVLRSGNDSRVQSDEACPGGRETQPLCASVRSVVEPSPVRPLRLVRLFRLRLCCSGASVVKKSSQKNKISACSGTMSAEARDDIIILYLPCQLGRG